MAKATTTATETTTTTEAKPVKTKSSAAQKEQARKARAGARIAGKAKTKAKKSVATPKADTAPANSVASLTTATASELTGTGGALFRAGDYITGDIWTPNPAIPAIDEATYEAHKTQAEGQSRSIEVASLNLKNINGLHKLEGQAVDIDITAKTNQTKYAKLEGAEIDYQTQLQVNSEKTEKLTQAAESYQFASRETGYRRQQIGLMDQNYQLDIDTAQTKFAEKTERYRAQLAGN